MADSDLTTVATAADVLGVSAADTRLPRLIGAASEAIRRYVGRPQLHYGAAIVEKLPGYAGQVRLYLGAVPLISVASVVLPDGTALSPTEYVVEDLDSAALYRREGWPFTGIDEGGVLHGEERSIVVTYAGGWVTPAQAGTRTLPFDLEEVCLQTVSALFHRQGADAAIASEQLGDYAVTYRNPNGLIGVGGLLPDAVLPQLATYRRLVA